MLLRTLTGECVQQTTQVIRRNGELIRHKLNCRESLLKQDVVGEVIRENDFYPLQQ